MASEAAKGGNFFRKHYRRGMIGLVAVTAIAAGGKLMWEQLSPKPEPIVSAQLTQQYFARFSRLGVTAIKKESRENCVKVERDGKETLYVSEINCTVPDLPSGDPWPPTFDVEREGRKLNVYAPSTRTISPCRSTTMQSRDAWMRVWLRQLMPIRQLRPGGGGRLWALRERPAFCGMTVGN